MVLDLLWLPLMVLIGRTRYGRGGPLTATIVGLGRTGCGSYNLAGTICGCHNWSPRTNCSWDQIWTDRPRALLVLTGAGRIPRLKSLSMFDQDTTTSQGGLHAVRVCKGLSTRSLFRTSISPCCMCVCAECAICRRLFRTRPDTSAQVSQFSTSPSPSACSSTGLLQEQRWSSCAQMFARGGKPARCRVQLMEWSVGHVAGASGDQGI